MVHLATERGDSRCGMSRSTRYGLSIQTEQDASTVTCSKCKAIAERDIERHAARAAKPTVETKAAITKAVERIEAQADKAREQLKAHERHVVDCRNRIIEACNVAASGDELAALAFAVQAAEGAVKCANHRMSAFADSALFASLGLIGE